MAYERSPLLSPRRPLWVRVLWYSAPLLAAFAYWISTMLHGGSVACDADAAKIALSQALTAENKGTITISGLETVSSNKTKILCAAKVQKDGGQSTTVMYEILLEQPTTVSIITGLDKSAPADRNEAGAEEEKREIATDASPEDDERGCAQAEDSGLRVASCGRVIARGAGSVDDRAEAYMHRGDAYFAMSDFGQAVLDYEQAIALSPSKPEGFIKQGDALAAGGEQAKALGSYEQAIRLDPKNAAVYDARGCSYVAAGVFAKAEADFRKAKSLGDKSPGEQCHEAFAELRAKNDSGGRKKSQIRNDDYDTEKEAPSNR